MASTISLDTHKALLSSILSYLSSLKQSPFSSSLLPNPDSLDAALDCLTEATGLPLPTSPPSPSLPSIYTAGLTSLPTPSQPSDSDPHFQQFLSLLTSKGFFQSLTPSTPPYLDRLAQAKAKYAEKYPQGSSTPKPVSEADKAAAEKLKNEGNSFLSSGQHSQAIDKYTAAITLNPQSAIYYANRAAAYINTSNYVKAEADCRSAIQIDPNYGKAHYRLGQSLLQQKRPADAIPPFEAALKLIDGSMREAVEEQLDTARRAVGAVGKGEEEEEEEDGEGGMDFSSILKNPMFAQLASQMGGGGAGGGGGFDFNALLNNPQIMQMASQMFGGGGGGGGAAAPPSRASPSSSSTDPMASFLNSPAAAELANDPDLAPVLEDVRVNGASAMTKHMGNPAVMAKLTKLAGPMMAAMKK